MKPTAFGKYLLLERIAVGGMAEVFLAKSFGIEGFERILAIKRILPQLAEDKAFIGMFIDEARIAGQLGHANVTPIYELGKVGSAHYIAMEHVWGKDLLQIMNRFRRLRTRMPAGMVAYVGARMCEALDYAHHKRDAQGNPLGLIHRDVSPQNVLVSYDGAVKLIDFGVAKAKTRTTKTAAGVVKGKFGYMSPEQVRGKKIDHRSDIFALGTCLYEMITLERLFAEDTDFDTMEKIRKAKIPPPGERVPGLPAALDEVVMKALTKDPGKRYQTAAEVQEALTRIVMTEEPRQSPTALAEWMQTAFADEMRAEKSRLDSYARVKLRSEVPGEPSSSKKLLLDTTSDRSRPDTLPPIDSTAGGTIDETMIGPPPIALPEEWPDEPTQIFFSSEANDVTATGNIPAPVVAAIVATVQESKKNAAPAPEAPPPVKEAAAAAPAVAPPASVPPPPPPPLAGAARALRDSEHDWSAKEAPTGWLSDGDRVVRASGAPRSEKKEIPLPAPRASAPERERNGAADPSATAERGDPADAPARRERHAPLPNESTPRLPPDAGGRTSSGLLRAPGAGIPAWKAAAIAAAALVLGAGGTYAALEASGEDGEIEIHAYPEAAANVTIDGVAVGPAPVAPRAIRPGTHVVEIDAEGFRSVTRPVIVRPESRVTLHVELAPELGVSQR